MNPSPPQVCRHRELLNLPGRGFRAVGDEEEEEGKSMRASEKDGRVLERERGWGTAGKGKGRWGKKKKQGNGILFLKEGKGESRRNERNKGERERSNNSIWRQKEMIKGETVELGRWH